MDWLIEQIIAFDRWIRFIHIAGAIIALGAVMMADILLAWLKLKPSLAPIISRLSPLLSFNVWLGLFFSASSGLLLFLPMQGLATVPLFQLKMGLVFLIFINGIFLNVWVTPRFERLVPEWKQQTKAVFYFTVVAGISAAVSLLAWWGVILLMWVFY